jgi:hypothetical protein
MLLGVRRVSSGENFGAQEVLVMKFICPAREKIEIGIFFDDEIYFHGSVCLR